MGRGTTRGELLTDLRNELQQSPNPAISRGSRDYHIRVITRVQKRLWLGYDWPHMQVTKTIPIAAGQRYYDFPQNIDFNRVQKIRYRWSDRWYPVTYGISEEQYNIHDPERNERYDPIKRWHIHEAAPLQEQFEVWPLPALNGSPDQLSGSIRITGIRRLGEFNSDNDRADLDDDLIVLFSAAEILMKKDRATAQLRLQEAQDLYNKLRGGQSKKKAFQLGAIEDPTDEAAERPPLRVVVGQSVY